MTPLKKCFFCGGETFESRLVPYVFSRKGRNLFVPQLPAQVCTTCGMEYYDGPTLLEVERRFDAIYERAEEPDRYELMPVFEASQSRG